MKWRILLVDDEPDIRLIVRTTLEPQYEILEAHDGLDALEKIERYEPDFVLMDVMMPLMNGFEACAAIRGNQKFHELPVMFLSAMGGKEDMKKGYTAGANLYLTKPFETARLLRNIDVFFEKTPPPRKARRYTIQQIEQAELEGKTPIAPGAGYESFLDLRSTGEVRRPDASPPPPSRTSRPSGASVPRMLPPSSAETHIPEEVTLQPRVMVVDDDREIVDMMKMSLADIAEVVTAYDGMEAIERLVKYQPDILVIDIMLPKMNGFQLCQSLRANRAFARLPIIMCSAKGAERDITFAKRVGANDYLVKPFSPFDLMEKVKEMQRTAGFRVRPKTFTIAQISDMEMPNRKKDVFQADEEVKSVDSGNRALSKFLQREGQKEGLGKEEVEPEAKKKRRFFGLGGKE
ncbi:hypothetical protein BH09SUM1_BH09SUM1_12870 [soil metagenome]